MTDPTLAAVVAKHEKVITSSDIYGRYTAECKQCKVDWPCDVVRLADDYEAREHQLITQLEAWLEYAKTQGIDVDKMRRERGL